MKSLLNFHLITLTVIFLLISIRITDAGTRYKDIVFSSLKVTENIQFGSNISLTGSNTPLFLDVYEPANDTLKLRPLVVFIHGGSLLTGTRTELSRYCENYAKRGYVAVTIDYRLGIELPKVVRTVSEALLRGVQDTKAAVRFLRSKAADYGIDTSKIYLAGSSAGSMIAVQYAYWDQDEIPSDINQAKWGNIEGTSGNPGFSTAIKGVINYCGALVNASWIEAGDVPVANFHGLLDNLVPADSGVSTDFSIMLYGGVAISRKATQLGIYNQGAFFPQMGHGGNEDSLFVFGPNFLYSLMVLSSATPQNFKSFTMSQKSSKIFLYDNFTFITSGVDEQGNRIILPSSMIQFSCDSRIGTIKPTGVFTPASRADSGYVYAKYNNMKDSCFVKTYDFKYFRIRPKIAVTDTTKNIKLFIDTYDADSVKHDLALSKFKLISTNPVVGTIDASGLFTPKKNGSTSIIASCSSYTDTSLIRVESARGIVTFDALESLDGWTFTGNNLDSLSVTLAADQKSAGNASFKIGYKFTYDPQKYSYMVYLNKALPVYGVPDSIYLDVKSDGRKHKLSYLFSDDNSELYRASGKKYMDNTLIFDNVYAPMTGMQALSSNSQFNYPLTLNRIEIQLAGNNVSGQSSSGTIYIDNLRLKYPGTTAVENKPFAPGLFSLEQNYPNPFNPITIINYTLPMQSYIELKVYDILGREVSTLVSKEQNAGGYKIQFDGSSLSSGMYIYRIKAGNYVKSQKMLLLK